MRNVWRLAIWPAIVFNLQACAGEGGTAGAAPFTTADSAGITIATSGAPLEGRWSLSSAPITRIGTLDGDSTQIIGDVAGATVLASGEIAVGDRQASHVRVYDAGGSYVRTVGRQGEGPGEFQLPLSDLVTWHADSVLAVEVLSRRVSVLGPDLQFQRLIRPDPGFDFRGAGGVPEQSCCPFTGWIGSSLVIEYPGVIPEDGRGHSTVRVVSVDLSGSLQDTIATLASTPYEPYDRPGGFNNFTPLQLGNRASTVADGTSLYSTSGDRFEVTKSDLTGRTVALIRLDREPTPIDQAMKDAYIHRMDSLISAQIERHPESAQESGNYLDMLEQTSFAEALPAITDLHVGRDGTLWLNTGLQRPEMEKSIWEAISEEGRWIATLEIPARAVPEEFGEDYVLLREWGEFDEQYVSMYRLIKNGDDGERIPLSDPR